MVLRPPAVSRVGSNFLFCAKAIVIMHSLAFILGTVCVLAWIYLLAGRGRFWMVNRLGTESRAPDAASCGLIAVIIPARNEADVIGRAVSSLLEQRFAGSLHVFVVDDNSDDGTAGVAHQAALASSYPEAVTLIAGRPLPTGWSGKLWAMKQGIEQALTMQPDYLLLTDADVQHSPENVATIVGVAERGSYDLTSFMVKLHCRSVAEKLLIPAFVFFFFMLYPPEWIRNPRRKTAGAAGGCMLIRPAALECAGGIAAIRDAILTIAL
jgi:hopene-associated glycosyltransferase HpnB